MTTAVVLAALAMTATPTPSPRQLAWHSMEMYAFAHFGPNTFSGLEWGHGTEDPNSFQPKNLDCRQWCRVLKEAGMKGIILTAKHHDGFCLWPSRESTHTVAQSRWRGGKGDVLRELAEACRASKLKLGVYLSPWDRNHPQYGTPEYNAVFARMLREVLTGYGPIFEVWFDGANGEGPSGKRQVYDWDLFIRTVRECQPKAVIFSDAGPDIRWVGNENGFAGETNWCTLNRRDFFPGTPEYAKLTEGQREGADWVPAECDVSIRPGWFWRASEDAKVKSVDELMAIWYGSVGRGANLLLNVPPNAAGKISEVDAKRLIEFRRAREAALTHEIRPQKTTRQGNILRLDFAEEARISHVVLRENIREGQHIARFSIMGSQSSHPIAAGTTVGVQRILRIAPATTKWLEVKIEEGADADALQEVRVYR